MYNSIVKWAGGKRNLISDIRSFYKDLDFNNYYEPFFGSGSVYLDIIKTFGNDKINKSYINDINIDLMNLYRDVKNNPYELIKTLYKIKNDYDNYGYYYIRDNFNGINNYKYNGIERSASLLVLNKTCFNGLFRVNKNGLFNVPKGNYLNPSIINENSINLLSKILPPINNILSVNFTEIDNILTNDLVYFDPPYKPISKTSSFTNYSGNFNDNDQVNLFKMFSDLDDNGTYVILSNSSSSFISDLYSKYKINIVKNCRTINSKSDGRGKINEVIIIGNTLKNKLKI